MIEVMIAILLTAIATSGIIGLYVVETRASGFSRHTTEATILAQDRMERLRTSGFVGATVVESGLDEQGLTGGMFDREYEVISQTDWDDMTVTVKWTEDGYARQVILQSRRNHP
jgi:Tfp pilus assembly protein PilV